MARASRTWVATKINKTPDKLDAPGKATRIALSVGEGRALNFLPSGNVKTIRRHGPGALERFKRLFLFTRHRSRPAP